MAKNGHYYCNWHHLSVVHGDRSAMCTASLHTSAPSPSALSNENASSASLHDTCQHAFEIARAKAIVTCTLEDQLSQCSRHWPSHGRLSTPRSPPDQNVTILHRRKPVPLSPYQPAAPSLHPQRVLARKAGGSAAAAPCSPPVRHPPSQDRT